MFFSWFESELRSDGSGFYTYESIGSDGYLCYIIFLYIKIDIEDIRPVRAIDQFSEKYDDFLFNMIDVRFIA